MDISIQHEGFGGRGLAVRTAGFFKRPRLLIDGNEVKGKRLRYTVRDNSGKEVPIRLKANFLDPIPRVEIASNIIDVARRFRWYEYVWMGLPILLVFAGGGHGGLGILIGLMAVHSSTRVFRSERRPLAKYALSALISLAAVSVFVVLIILIQGTVHQ